MEVVQLPQPKTRCSCYICSLDQDIKRKVFGDIISKYKERQRKKRYFCSVSLSFLKLLYYLLISLNPKILILRTEHLYLNFIENKMRLVPYLR